MRKTPKRSAPQTGNDRPSASAPRDEFLARAFAGVKPLAAHPRIVPRPRDPLAAQAPSSRLTVPSFARFVLERTGEELWGYRSDLGPGALRDLRSSRWRPQHELDLHGRRTQGLQRFVAGELRRLVGRGKRRLLVIHGKGLHSQGGTAILREAVVDALTEGDTAALVRALHTAPLRLGGTGALAVELDVRGR